MKRPSNLPPGYVPGLRYGLSFSSEIPLSLNFSRPILPQIQEVLSLSFLRTKLEFRAPAAPKQWKN